LHPKLLKQYVNYAVFYFHSDSSVKEMTVLKSANDSDHKNGQGTQGAVVRLAVWNTIGSDEAPSCGKQRHHENQTWRRTSHAFMQLIGCVAITEAQPPEFYTAVRHISIRNTGYICHMIFSSVCTYSSTYFLHTLLSLPSILPYSRSVTGSRLYRYIQNDGLTLHSTVCTMHRNIHKTLFEHMKVNRSIGRDLLQK